ncbi:HNH endonuclease [Eggerthellaceae bacterium zg-997]|nr:HNH endonuclease [Eggerthellaceae bacterium zg-997]
MARPGDRYGSPEGRRLRLRCFDRDRRAGAPCWICGGSIDYRARPGATPESWEGDHVRPRHSHPHLAMEESNIAASHRRCNRGRRDRPRVSDLGEPTRDWFEYGGGPRSG